MRKYLNSFSKSFLVNFLSLAGSASLVLADDPATPAGGAAGGSVGASQPPGAFGMFVPMLAVFGVFYFLMIRPQQKKAKEQQEMLTALKHGDDVLTSSGILGKVAGITEKFVTIEVADNVKIKMLKSQVSQVVKGGEIQEQAK